RVEKDDSVFDADGRTLLFEETHRADGTLQLQKQRRNDGGVVTTGYRADGKTIRLLEVANPNSTVNRIYYRGDGTTVWAKMKLLGNQPVSLDYYGSTGVLEHRREYRTDGTTTITVFRPDGTVSL